ncbi:MAG: glycosyltransferase family 39 protein [Candidatus Hydrothermarchaeales archaeon]
MKGSQKAFLVAVYLLGVFLRLYPRLSIDAHLLTFQGDIWYRLAMAQYILDYTALPSPDLRYLAYGEVPMWYPPLSPIFLAGLSYLSSFDLPTVSSRIVPFIEALSPLSLFFLVRYMYDETAAYISTLALALTPTFVFWTGISDPQSLTLFLIPLYILLWLRHSQTPANKNVLILGVVLAANFLVHLSYFVAFLVLFSVSIALGIRKEAKMWLLRDLFLAIFISQLLTALWWLPNNLYWWWIKALVTSSGMYSMGWQIGDFGVVAVLFGVLSLIYVATTRGSWKYVLFFWALPLFIESQNEAILFAVHRVDLTWTTLGKPLEGFRFFPYLAQPVAIAIGAFFSRLSDASFLKSIERTKLQALMVLLMGSAFLWGITGLYHIDVKFQTSGLIPQEYKAALWFRENSNNNSRIAADYYRAQMFTGVTGGKAIDGGMFPLRNVDLPYISVPATVQDDLYILYTTEEPKKAHDLAKRYGLTHIFYSKNMEDYGNLLSKYKPASDYGIPIYLEKFNVPKYFRPVYEDAENNIKIFEVV